MRRACRALAGRRHAGAGRYDRATGWRENVDDDAIYLLVDRGRPHARRQSGATGRSGVARADAWYELPVERAGVRILARVQRFDLPGGYHLLVGRDVRTRAQLRRLLTDALFWALFIVIALGVAGALVVRGLFRRMLANVSATAAAIVGRRSRPAGAALRPRRRVRPARRDDQRHARPHRAADGRRAPGLERDRARSAHADRPRPRAAGGCRRSCPRRGRICAPRSSARPPISTR